MICHTHPAESVPHGDPQAVTTTFRPLDERSRLDTNNAVARKGKVRSIRCAYSRYAPGPGGDGPTLYPLPGTAEIRPAERVDGNEHVPDDLHFNGYLVELDLELN